MMKMLLIALAVTHIVDGDTVDIDNVRYRLAGIDTPEGAQYCLNAMEVKYDCGAEATRALEQLLADGQYTIRVTGTDYWGREIAWFDLPGGGTINCTLVRNGYAWAYRKYSKACIADEVKARNERLGVFATDNLEPWNWRHRK